MVYSEKFFVGFSDVSFDLGITNTAIIRLFEDVCCLHGEAVGDGIFDTDGRWFMTVYHVKVLKRPKYGEWVTAKTWSREMKGVSASREFELYDQSGELAVIALTNWVRMNSKTGRPERMTAEDFAKYGSEPERRNFEDPWAVKLRDISEPLFERELQIGRSLIDPNRHVNNIYYLDLAVDTLPDNKELLADCDEFEITYRKAIAYGNSVKCLYSEDEKSCSVAIKSLDMSETFAIVKLYK